MNLGDGKVLADVLTSAGSWNSEQPLLTYTVPTELQDRLCAGQLVAVPYGERLVEGIVWDSQLDDETWYTEGQITSLRPISAILDPEPALLPHQRALAGWMAEYYVTPLAHIALMMLPHGLMQRSQIVLHLVKSEQGETGELQQPEAVSLRLQALIGLLLTEGELDIGQLKQMLGPKRAREVLKEALASGLIEREAQLSAPRAKKRIKRVVRLVAQGEHLQASRQRTEACLQQSLPEDIHINIAPDNIRRRPKKSLPDPWAIPGLPDALTLTPQDQAGLLAQRQLAAIDLLQNGTNERGSSSYWIPSKLCKASQLTASQLHALVRENIIARGKRGIVLVPEIVLTTQAILRFAGRFPGRVAIIHGDLFVGERYDEWRRIRAGKVDVVIGSRSALFSPLPDLGLIILDEEHEPAYKQSEHRPTYHAREAAITLGRILQIPVVLGTATPSAETFYRAEQGEYSLVELPGRIGAALPPVEVVDLRSELHAGNTSIISRLLHSELEQVLRLGQQAILFLNRRGAASCVLCRVCGFVAMCDRCDVPLTYHSTERILLCHYCNRQSKVLYVCPQCTSPGIRYFGLGTEKVMHTIQHAFPSARLLRWDRDTASNHRAHQGLLDRFSNREADILVGTQMIAKGLDLPGVTLVGVISADIALNLPDFAASERAFTLLTQLAGRAGRSAEGGRVSIQASNQLHLCIDAALRHDFYQFSGAKIKLS